MQGLQRVSAPSENRTHIARLTVARLTVTLPNSLRLALPTKPLLCSHIFILLWRKKRLMLRRFSQPGTAFLLAGLSFDCSGWISRPDMIYQNLERKIWSIHLTAFDIDWSWKFASHNLSYSMLTSHKNSLFRWAAQFSLDELRNAHCAAHRPLKVKTENFKFRTGLRDLVMDGWSVTQ